MGHVRRYISVVSCAAMNYLAFDSILLLFEALNVAEANGFDFQTFSYATPDLANLINATIKGRAWYGLTVRNGDVRQSVTSCCSGDSCCCRVSSSSGSEASD